MRVVFDTNVFVSAFILPGSQGDRALGLARRGAVQLVTSVPILTELAAKLREKFDQSEDDVREALRLLSRAADIVKSNERLAVLDDAPDNRILECAVAGAADVIVSGDRHLLDLGVFRGIAIVRLADFLRMVPSGTTTAGARVRPGQKSRRRPSRR